MKRWITCLGLIGVLAAPASWAASKDKTAEEDKKAKGEELRDGSEEKAENRLQGQSTPVGKGNTGRPVVVISEAVFVDMTNLPATLTEDGLKAFKSRNFGTAGNDFASAGRVLTIQAKRADNQNIRKEMTQAGEKLIDLGERVSEGKVKSQEELNKELATVAYHKAHFHRLQAIEEWNDKEARKAAHDLSAAAEATESGLKWTGEEIEKGTMATLEGAKRVSGKVLEGGGWTVAEVGKAIDDVGSGVKNLGDRLDEKPVAH